MANNLFNALGGKQQQAEPMQAFFQQFNQFRQSFRGDPKQEVMKLLQSGRMTQQQFNQLGQAANRLLPMMKK